MPPPPHAPYGTSASWDTGAAPIGPQQGWAAAPQPALFPLRPMSFGELFSTSFKLLRTNIGVSLGSGVIVMAVTSLLTIVVPLIVAAWVSNRVAMAATEDRDVVAASAPFWFLISMIPGVLLTLFGSALLQVIIARVVASASLNQPLGFKQAWGMAAKRMWPMLGYFLLQALISFVVLLVLGGLMALFIWLLVSGGAHRGPTTGQILGIITVALVFGLGIIAAFYFFQIKLMFGPAAVTLERLGPLAALKRSWTLSNGYFWRSLGVVLLIGMIVAMATQAVGMLTSFVLPIVSAILIPTGSVAEGQEPIAIGVILVVALLMMAVSMLMGTLTTVLTSGNAVIMYTDLRMRKEGLNIHLQRATDQVAAGQEPDPDPWTAPDLGPVPEPDPYAAQQQWQQTGYSNQPTYPPAAGYPQPGAYQPYSPQPGASADSPYAQSAPDAPADTPAPLANGAPEQRP